ncbi:MAG: DUF2244 domain-containing protein [Gammaproteobacteria bacterium]
MITEFDASQNNCQKWMIRPNRSMTWREAKFFVAGVAIASISIGIYFLWLGYPLVLPFSGLEALAVGVAFYLVLRSGEITEVISVSERKVIVEKGRREPESKIEFDRTWANVTLKHSPNRWYPSKLLINSHGRYVEVGHFLSEGERESLAKLLINVIGKNR